MFIALDESGIHKGSPWMAFGVLWLPDDAKVPEFEATVTRIRQENGCWAEFKWCNVSARYRDAYLDFTRELIALPGLKFTIRVVEAATVEPEKIREYNGEHGRNLAYLKFMRRTIQYRIGRRGVAIGQRRFTLLFDDVSGKDDIKQRFRDYLRGDLAAAAREYSAEGCEFAQITKASSKVVALLQAVDLVTGATCSAWTEERVANPDKQAARDAITAMLEGWRGAPLTAENERGAIDIWRHRWKETSEPPPGLSGAVAPGI